MLRGRKASNIIIYMLIDKRIAERGGFSHEEIEILVKERNE
jgi:hypothetical protein